MSTTLEKTMTVLAARRRLSNTSGLSSEQVDEAHAAVAAFYATKPQNQRCVACGCMRWEEHETASGGATWACASCRRPPSLTAEAWHLECTRQQEAAEERQRAADAAAVPPRTILRERLAALAAARAEAAKLERAAPVARSGAWEAQARVDAAAAAAAEANEGAASSLAAALAEGKPFGPSSSAAKARAALADAADALATAKSARGMVEEKLQAARTQVDFVFDKCRKAARSVIAGEMLEGLLNAATEARAEYIDALGSIAWLMQQHAIPAGDARPRQLLADGNCPPSAWPESASAGVQVMQAAFDALMADAAAVI